MYWLYPVLIYECGLNSFSDFPIESLDPSFLPHLKWCSEPDETILTLNEAPFPKAELAKSKLDCIQSLTPAILATHWDLISANSHAGFDASYYYPTQCITVLDNFHSTVLLVFYGLHQANQTRWITVQLTYSQEPSNHSRLARMIHHPADIEAHASPSLVWF